MHAHDSRSLVRRLASNYAWTWDRDLRAALEAVLGEHDGRHPLARLADLDDAALDAAVAAAGTSLTEAHERVVAMETASRPAEIAYLSPEFGVSETLPQYSGGLGILAGDHLKAASDLELPLVGVGLFYANGYFTQSLVDGSQKVGYDTYRPAELGLRPTGVVVVVDTPRGSIRAAVWEAWIGRTRLVVLDTRTPGNAPWARSVTNRLYGGDQQKRIDQEWLLGVGGVRALAALGLHPPVIHLNEGHAGFGLLELAAQNLGRVGTLTEAMAEAGRRVLFTTHTPVPAGIDRFERALVQPYLEQWARPLGLDPLEVFDLGILPADEDPDVFNMAALSLRTATLTNGVSTLHGEVSRELFSSLPEGQSITSVTNGVHARTWVHPQAQDLLDDAVGPRWERADPDAWKAAGELSDDAVAKLRTDLRAEGLGVLADHYGIEGLDPDALTIGFARRFATYKRAALVLRESERLAELLADRDRPVQFLFAGKAHPADKPGQAVLAEVVAFGDRPESSGRFRLIPDYDVRIAQAMYAASDVWLNNPVRPREASGTSGEKSALNGGLNCSILDGWWAEWYFEDNGWAIPTSDLDDDEARDDAEAAALIELLAGEVIPTFYGDGPGPSAAWCGRVRAGWMHLGPRVTAARMVAEYRDRLYGPIAAGLRERTSS